jgi:hypothetical protein
MTVLNIPITKAGNRKIEVDTTSIPEEMYLLALEEGLKVLLNKKMSKITTAKLEGDDLAKAQEAAFTQGTANYNDLMAGKLRKGRAGPTTADGKKVPGVVMTEARRLAKEVVKNEIRAAGMKISHVEASEITKAANALIEADPSFIASATANIEARAQVKPSVDIKSLIHESPKLVKAAEEAKAARKTQLSAKQAGKVAPRKGSAPTANA